MANRKYPESERLGFDKLKKMSEDSAKRIHFVGIGGISMYSLAHLTIKRGACVSGSDREESERTESLKAAGASIYINHSAANVEGADLVVYTHAISEDNPELLRAKELAIPLVSRAEYLGAMMISYKKRIGVSGSHGKSTVTAMLDAIFTAQGSEPTVLSGAKLSSGEPMKLASSDLLIYEACEYRDSFLKFEPTVAVGLNLEHDHVDYFENLASIRDSFKRALSRASDFVVVNGDDDNFRPIIKQIKGRVITFGQSAGCDYRYSITAFREGGFDFSLTRQGKRIGRFSLNIPGSFNVANAAAAATVALECGIDADVINLALGGYMGIPRRLERVGARYTRAVYYDYAHHPTEISAAINALKMHTRDPLTVIFKPHTYTRTARLWEDFKRSLSLADHLILTPIYPAREEQIEGITSARLAREIGPRAKFAEDDDVIHYLDLHTHGAIVIMGAGDMTKIKKDVLYKYV